MKYLGPEQRGSAADRTASRNPYGQYLKARTGRGTPPLYDISAATGGWEGITDGQRRDWDSWAAELSRRDSLGQETGLTGRLAFIRQYMVSLASGGNVPLPVDAPPSFRRTSITSITAGAPSAGSVVWTATLDITGYLQGTSSSFIVAERPGVNRPPGRGHFWRQLIFAGPIGTAGMTVFSSVFTTGWKQWARMRAWDAESFLPSTWVLAGPVVL